MNIKRNIIGAILVICAIIVFVVYYVNRPNSIYTNLIERQTKTEVSTQTEAIMPKNTTYVYLIHPMLVELPEEDIKIRYRIRIHNKYIIGNNVIDARPVFISIYGKNIIIPLYNIRLIVKGDNKFKEHIIE